MKLSRLLVGLISLLWVLVFVATLAIVVSSTKDYLKRAMQSHAQDAATSLGLSITHSRQLKDTEIVERMVAAIFDRGYYSEIIVRKTSKDPKVPGAAIVTKRVQQAVEGVPQWFIGAFTLPTPRMSAGIMDGWRQGGSVEVVSHPGHAYAELWRVSKNSAGVLLIVAIISLLVVVVVLRMALRPLDDMERQAINIAKRQFTILDKLPWARELHRISSALNSMCLAVERMLGEQTALTEKMRQKAYVDPVTGLMNRNDFSEKLAHLISAPEDFGTCALVVVRVHGFLEYNQKNGRPAGDAMLQKVSQLLSKVADKRERAMLARLDGPEFSLMVPELAVSDLPALGDELIAELAAIEEFPHTENSVMAHAGIAHYLHREGASFGRLMGEVNAALNVAQGRGMPAWHVHETAAEADTQAAAINNQVTALFKEGLTPDRVTVQYQSVVACKMDDKGWLYHAEAWVRVTGQDGAIIPAGLFIPVAKRLGVLEQIDRMVIEKVMERITTGGSVHGGATAINLSPDTVAESGFIDWVCARLAANPVIAKQIIFEIPEHAIINRVETIKTAFHRLRETGARCSIDRFGQSTASVGFLRSLEVDYIKIDGSYTRGIIQSTDRQFFVQALVGIAHGLGIQVVTEHIESAEEFEMVKGLMVDGAQGYFIGKPE